MEAKTIIMLAGPGDSTYIVYHSLAQEFTVSKVIIEEPVPTSTFLKKRAAKMGWPKVFGQILFKVVAGKILETTSAKRIRDIQTSYNLNSSPIPEDKILRVKSINAPESIAAIQELKPDVIVVNGTRIISKAVLASTQAPFLNTHAGINPLYRGVHGGYWALTNKDTDNCGVTVHVVDPGIDTGGVLYQAKISPTAEDNFVTYPLLQLQAGLPHLKQAVRDAFTKNLKPQPNPPGQSRLWSHPTLWEYLYHRSKGVK